MAISSGRQTSLKTVDSSNASLKNTAAARKKHALWISYDHARTPETSRTQLCRNETGVAETGIFLQGNGYGTENEMRPARLRLPHRSSQTSRTLIGSGPTRPRPRQSTCDLVLRLAPYTKRLRNNSASSNRCSADLRSYRGLHWRHWPNRLNPAPLSPAKPDYPTAPISFDPALSLLRRSPNLKNYVALG